MIIVRSPRGIAPFYDAKALDDAQAQTAENCVLKSGKAVPLKALSSSQSLEADTISVFKVGSTWLEFDAVTHLIQSPVDAENDRYYYTDGTNQKKQDSSVGPYDLGVAQPSTGPSLTVNGTGDGTTVGTWVYVYTRVTAWGEESAPSQPSGEIEPEGDEYITFTGLSDGSDSHVTNYRLYRAVAGSESSGYLKVPYQTTAGTLQYDDVYTNMVVYDIPKADIGDMKDGAVDSQLGEELNTDDWYEPPSDLDGITDAGNGIIFGFSGKNVCFSQLWIPYAWPTDYQYALDEDVVAVGHAAGVPVALTDRSVYVFEGSSPDSFYQRKVTDTQGCMSARSVVSTKYGVFFASSDGLCLALPDQVKVLTKGIWSKDQWNVFSLSSLAGFFFDGDYYAFFDADSEGFIFPLSSDRQDVTTFDMTHDFKGGFVDPANDKLYLNCDTGAARNLYEFDAGNDLTMTWKSKEFESRPKNFSRFVLIGEAGASTVTYTGDDTEVMSQSVTHNSPIALPSGALYRKHEIQIAGTKEFSAWALANSSEELKANGL